MQINPAISRKSESILLDQLSIGYDYDKMNIVLPDHLCQRVMICWLRKFDAFRLEIARKLIWSGRPASTLGPIGSCNEAAEIDSIYPPQGFDQR